MRSYLSVLITTAVIMAFLYLNSFVLRDRSVFVPAPDSVTEQFMKLLKAKRFSLAASKLSDNSSYKDSIDSLKKWEKRAEQRLGKYEVSGGNFRYASESTALANVRLRGVSGEYWPVFLLVKEKGLWKIEKMIRDV